MPFGLTFSPTITLLLMNHFLLLTGGCGLRLHRVHYIDFLSAARSRRWQSTADQSLLRKERPIFRSSYPKAGISDRNCDHGSRMVGVYLARAKVGVLFGASPEANTGVIQYLPFFLATLLFLAFVRITTSYFYATEKNGLSYLLVYAEPVCTLLMLLILPPMLMLTGVWLAVPIAQVITFVMTCVAKRRVDTKI